MITLGALAEFLELSSAGLDEKKELHGIRPLADAARGDLAFVADRKYLDVLRNTRAGCVLLREEWLSDCPVPALVCPDPYLAYARASSLFANEPVGESGIHPTAIIHSSAQLADDVSIGPHVCIEAGARLGAGVQVGSGCFVGAQTELGDRTRLFPNVVLYHQVVLGRDCRVHSNTSIGIDGFGFARHPEGWTRICQLGGVRIGDRVDIGSGVTIDRGALEDTCISSDVIIDNQVHIAHNCVIGERTAIAGCVGMAGSTVIGADCTFGGQVGLGGHITICDNAHFAGQARVSGSVDKPGAYGSGTPLQPQREWAKNAVRFTKLDALNRRVAQLEARLAAQEAQEAQERD